MSIKKNVIIAIFILILLNILSIVLFGFEVKRLIRDIVISIVFIYLTYLYLKSENYNARNEEWKKRPLLFKALTFISIFTMVITIILWVYSARLCPEF